MEHEKINLHIKKKVLFTWIAFVILAWSSWSTLYIIWNAVTTVPSFPMLVQAGFIVGHFVLGLLPFIVFVPNLIGDIVNP